MPTDTLIFVAAVVVSFVGFAVALAYADVSTKATRRKNHPIPGE